ncbi:hypothetical protein Tco_0077390 [Tanacetum coccineum]
MSAKSKIINTVRYITAKVASKPVSISEASIRSDLLFNDADGIDSLPNQAIFDAIQLMGKDICTTFTLCPPYSCEANVEPQSEPSPRPSPSTHIPDSIPKSSGGNHGGQSSSDKSLSGIGGCDIDTLKSQEALEESLTCYYTPQSLDEECILEAKIGRKEILKEKLDAKGVSRMEVDRLLALRLQDEEREKFTVEERAKFLHDTIAAQRRFLAEQRAIAIRNRPLYKNSA